MGCPAADWVAYAKGELPGGELRDLRLHLGSCPDCAKRAESTGRVLAGLGRLREREIEPSGEFGWRVRAAFLDAHPELLERPAAGRGDEGRVPTWVLALVLQVQVLAIVTLLVATPGRPEERDGHPVRMVDRGRDPEFAFIPPGSHRRFEGRKWAAVLSENRMAGLARLRREERDPEASGAAGRALDWLASMQEADGSWNPARFGGRREYAIGVTGLAVMAFLGNGETPESGPHAPALKRAAGWLLMQQRASGAFGDPTASHLYNHAIATCALLEYRLVSGGESLESPTEAAVAFILQAQNGTGGWGYLARAPENDASVGGWQILALRLALAAGDRSVIPALNASRVRLGEMTDADWRVGYRAPRQYPNGPYATTAIGMYSTMLSSPAPSRDLLRRQSGILFEGRSAHDLSSGGSGNDLCYWHFGSLALRQADGEAWERWRGPSVAALKASQRPDGSWPAAFDRWSEVGGQVYATAMGALILESEWRYPRLAE